MSYYSHLPPNGDIAANGLSEWWVNNLSPQERGVIAEAALSARGGNWSLAAGTGEAHPGGRRGLLLDIASYLPDDQSGLKAKIVGEAQGCPDDSSEENAPPGPG